MNTRHPEDRAIVRRGWAQLIVGALLAGGVGAVALNLAPELLRPGTPGADGAQFTGSGGLGLHVLGVLGLVVVFGLITLANGWWLIRTGRRNPWLLRIALGLLAVLALGGWSLRNALG